MAKFFGVFCLLVMFFSFGSATRSAVQTKPLIEQSQIKTIFDGYDTAFVLLNEDGSQNTVFNAAGCAERLRPCSTFKIVNALIGLETNVVKDLSTTFKWDGKQRIIASWNADQDLRSAIKNSTVWYFQELAKRIGHANMRNYLHKLHYGNEDMSGGLTMFWLDSLKISANEQAQLMQQLASNKISFSQRSIDYVKEGIKVIETDQGTLYGKTGSDMVDNKKVLGWFVGYVAANGRKYPFAVNIRATDAAWGPEARRLTEELFKRANLI